MQKTTPSTTFVRKLRLQFAPREERSVCVKMFHGLSLNFCSYIRMKESEFSVKHMKAQIRQTVYHNSWCYSKWLLFLIEFHKM